MVQAQYIGLDIMNDTKDKLDNPKPDVYINALIDFIAAQFPTLTHIGISVPMNTNAEAIAERAGNDFAIQPATYAQKFVDRIHQNGLKVLWRGTDCYFEGIYDFPKLSIRNGNRYTFFGDPITDNFSSSLERDHGYDHVSAAGNLSTNYLTSHQTGNSWSIVAGELTGPTASGWNRSILFNANYINNVTMTALVKKVGNQQIIVRATTDSNFPGYGLQMRDTNTLRIERPGLESLGEVSKTWVEGNWYWLKLQAIGTAIKGKSWAENDTEPGTWDIEITNATYTNGYCGFSGESNNGKFKSMTIDPEVDTDTWIYRGCDYIRDNFMFADGDQIGSFPEASSHQTLTNQGTYNQFFTEQKWVLDKICEDESVTCDNGFIGHLFTSTIQNAYNDFFDVVGVATYDHYGSTKGPGKRFESFNHGAVGDANTYTVPTSITENATNRHDFFPEKIAYNKTIDVYVVNKGTGWLKMVIHDSSHNLVQMPTLGDFENKVTTGEVTIPNASLVNGQMNTFEISWDNPVPDVAYHYHLVSENGDATVKCTTANDLNTAYTIGYKSNAEPLAYDIDIRKAYFRTGHPQYIQEWGDHWSTDPTASDPVRNETDHRAYLESMYAMKTQLVEDEVLIGYQYWRAIGGHEGVMENQGTDNDPDFALLYEGEELQDFFQAIGRDYRESYPMPPFFRP